MTKAKGWRQKAVQSWRTVAGADASEANTPTDDRRRMGAATLFVLVAYLMLGFVVSALVLWTLAVAEAKPGPATPPDSVSEPRFAWKPPFGDDREKVDLGFESRLALIVLFVGCLGATVASFNSLSNYRGEGFLEDSWLLHYVVAPWLGAGVALLTYLVLRAGHLGGSGTPEGSTIPWGMVAVAGLAGLFYDKSLLKLQQVFVTVFNPQDNRGGKLGELAVVTTSLGQAKVGEQYEATLVAKGGEGQRRWSVVPVLPAGLGLDRAQGVIQGTPEAGRPSAHYTFKVIDEKGASAESKLELEVVP